MDQSTILNRGFNTAITEINPLLGRERTTILNPALAEGGGRFLEPGTVLCGLYTVESRLDVASGEADLYLCQYENVSYIAKVYRREAALKEDVAALLEGVQSPYVARLYEFSFLDGFPVEIIPYYKNGSLQGRQYTLEELRQTVIPCINEGLRALHAKGIIHKDLKPSNMMLADDQRGVAIIDFGVSSAKDRDSAVIVTKTGMTPEYSAPETFRGLFLEESDYYSFGITLFELFCGYIPYANMGAEEIERYLAVQRIPFPDSMPGELRDLIAALTYTDLTNRQDKHNPNRRWTYEEVKRWCAGERLPLPGENTVSGGGEFPPYEFLGKQYADVGALVCTLAEQWEKGKRHLFRGHLSTHFGSSMPDLARLCLEAEDEARRKTGKDDVVFWRFLYRAYPGLRAFCWKGQRYETLSAFGRDMLERLWKNDKSQYSYYAGILSEQLLGAYVELSSPGNAALANAAAAVETSYQMQTADKTDIKKTYYLMAYLLSGQKLLCIDEQRFRTVGELAAHIRHLLDDSVDLMKRFCHRLVDYNGNLDTQLESWLIALGKNAELGQWREMLAQS